MNWGTSSSCAAVRMNVNAVGSLAAVEPCLCYRRRMRRTSVVLDERLLEEAVRVSGEGSYARTIERALTEFVQRARAQRISSYAGTGVWQGNLAEMRRDLPSRVRGTSIVSRRR